MVGMGSIVTKNADVRPGQTHIGNPAYFHGMNMVGLQRNNVDDDLLCAEVSRFLNIKESMK